MPKYLKKFSRRVAKEWKGSLVKVAYIADIEPNAKEYMSELAKAGSIERVTWGWYWIPSRIRDVWDFLEKDRNFKVISSQTAASLYNHDFIHRDVFVLKVAERSYGKALEEFAKRRGWNIEVEHVDPSRLRYKRMGRLFVETIEDTIVGCIQKWAFADAFATLQANRDVIDMAQLKRRGYWKRISGADVRVKQALNYGCHKAKELAEGELPSAKGPRLRDRFIQRGIDEAVEEVVEIG